MDEMDDFFGNDEYDREPSPVGEEAIEDNTGEGGPKRTIVPKLLRTKKATNPRLALNEGTLTGPKGIPALREAFKGFKPNPKDDPYANLEKMMKKYAYWGHMMFPKMKTEDVLNRVETLGTRRIVKVYLMKQRLGESTEDIEKENEKRKKNKNGIIDDGAEEEEEEEPDELFNDLPEKDPSPIKAKKTASPVKRVEEPDFDEEEEYRMMEDERLREEQDAKDAEAEDELMQDFDMNNDW